MLIIQNFTHSTPIRRTTITYSPVADPDQSFEGGSEIRGAKKSSVV